MRTRQICRPALRIRAAMDPSLQWRYRSKHVRGRSAKPSPGASSWYAQNSLLCTRQLTNVGCAVDAHIGGYRRTPAIAVQEIGPRGARELNRSRSDCGTAQHEARRGGAGQAPPPRGSHYRRRGSRGGCPRPARLQILRAALVLPRRGTLPRGNRHRLPRRHDRHPRPTRPNHHPRPPGNSMARPGNTYPVSHPGDDYRWVSASGLACAPGFQVNQDATQPPTQA
jgi:hypothetical protein